MGRVLIISPDDAQQYLLQVILERAGYQPVGAASASSALALLRQDDAFDVILSERRLPMADGAQLVRELRGSWPHIPVVVLTVYPDQDDPGELDGVEAAWLRKPFLAWQVVSILDRLRAPAPDVKSHVL